MMLVRDMWMNLEIFKIEAKSSKLKRKFQNWSENKNLPNRRVLKEFFASHKIPIDEENEPKYEACVEGQWKCESGEKIILQFTEWSSTIWRDVGIADELVDEGDCEVEKLNELEN